MFCNGFGYNGVGYNGFGGFGGILMMIIPIILVVLVIYAVFRLISQPRYDNDRNNNEALNILAQKYAQGDLSEEEYLKKKNILKR
jgi:putative membrane protein